jgi:probable F420-dependent oxidoreductase
MRVGLMFANGGRSAEPEHAAQVAQSAEATGFESLWTVQHVVMPVSHASSYPYSSSGTVPGGAAVAIPDPLVWLGWVGARTSTIRLATGVLILPQQHPLVIAKQAATLDRLTGGRVLLGVGAGWLEEEYAALDSDFAARGPRMDEAIEVLRRAWSSGEAEFKGQHLAFSPVHVEPKPKSRIPIVVGGHSAAAARRAGRIGDGFFPLSCQGDRLRELVSIVRESAREAERDPREIEITAEAPRTRADAETQSELGIARIVVNTPHVETARIAEAVAKQFEIATQEFS